MQFPPFRYPEVERCIRIVCACRIAWHHRSIREQDRVFRSVDRSRLRGVSAKPRSQLNSPGGQKISECIKAVAFVSCGIVILRFEIVGYAIVEVEGIPLLIVIGVVGYFLAPWGIELAPRF